MTLYFDKVYQLDVRQLVFIRMWHRGQSLLSTVALFELHLVLCFDNTKVIWLRGQTTWSDSIKSAKKPG